MKPIINIRGQKFGMLTVKSLSKTRNNRGQLLWNCVCECGGKSRVVGANLKNGNTRSCGCLKVNNRRGADNPSAKRSAARNGGLYVPSTDAWYDIAEKAAQRAAEEGVPYGFSSIPQFVNHIKSIAPTKCPVFHETLVHGEGEAHDYSPSVDRIVPSKGYVPGNLQIISMLANMMKQDASDKELDQFADWALRLLGKTPRYTAEKILDTNFTL